MKTLSELTEREILALAISSEEEDSRIYMTFAEDLAERYPTSAKMFEEMAEEEEGHRHSCWTYISSVSALGYRRSAERT